MLSNLRKLLFKKENIPLLVILIVAAFTRLYYISEFLTFLGDEGRDVLVVKHILEGNLTLLGPTASVGGFFLGPIYYYMMAPFLWLFNYDPLGPAVMIALIGVATVWLVYKVAREFFGYFPALAAALLYAVSPLVITYSRSSWNPNPVPFFALLMLYVLYKSVLKKSWKLMLTAGILFGILLQLHYLATFLGVIVALYVLGSTIFQFRKPIKIVKSLTERYVLFAVGTLIGWSPFLAFEVRHGFTNIQSIVKFIFTSGDTGNNEKYFTIVQDVFIRIFGRLLLAFPRVEDLKLYSSATLDLWGAAAYLLGISAIVFCTFKLFQAARHKKNSFYQYLLLLVWILVGILLFGFYKKNIYDYYFGFLFPVPFLLFAGVISFLWTKGKVSVVLTVIAVTGMVALNWYYSPIYYSRNNQLKQVRGIAEFVLSKTEGKPYNFAVISAGGNSDFAYRYFFETNHMPPTTIEYEGADPERKSVTDQLLIVCESVPCQPLGYSLWEVAGFGQAEIAGEWPVSVVKVYRLVHYKGK